MKEPFEKTKTKSNSRHTQYYDISGFWVSGAITVTHRKSASLPAWESPEVQWISGGRDFDGEPSNLAAAENFALALADAIETAKAWEREMQGGES